MRASLIALLLLSMVAAPLAAAWPSACAHESEAMTPGDGHGMHDAMPMDVDTHDGSACRCDIGCAGHCDAAAPAVPPGIDGPDQPTRVTTAVNSAVRAFDAGPPRAAPLRPPQTRS